MLPNRIVATLVGGLAFGALASAGPVTISIDNSPLSALPGSTVTFWATMTNTTGATQYLVGDSFTTVAPFSIGDFDGTPLLLSWPTFLLPNETVGTLELFSLAIPVSTSPGLYTQTFNLFGGQGANDQNLLGTASFNVEVLATPEPSTAALGLVGLGTIVVLIRRRDLTSRFAR